MGEIVFRSLPVLQDNGRAHCDRGNREDGEHGPLRPCHIGVDAKVAEIVVGYLLKTGTDICRGQLVLNLLAVIDKDLRERGWFFEIDLELLLTAVRAEPLFFDILLREDIAGKIVFGTHNFLDLLRGEEKPAAATAGHTEELPDQPGIPDMDYRFCELDVTEMPGAFACLLVTGLASEARINNPEIQVHQTLGIRKSIIIVGIRPYDLPHAHGPDLLWRKESEFDLSYSLWAGHDTSSYTTSSSLSLGAIPMLFISSRRSLNAYDISTG
ncbi:MAG: hypothetical protein A4E38_00789 [Methanoregulaceae archaeon PtaB.Bin108]|nr:MAG: hypothetical protein A4E38_00789 [Methanoregulaceae archaeon PtaB.Bin108]